MTSNQIAYQNLVETGRANRVREQETNRSNLAQEGLRLQELQEAQRANRAKEEETAGHNRATETEANRSNLARELENSIHNRVSESIEKGKLAENIRNNTNQYGLGLGQLMRASSADTLGASTQRYVADSRNEATKYSADVGSNARIESANIGAQAAIQGNLINATQREQDSRRQAIQYVADKPLNDAKNVTNIVTNLADSFTRLSNSQGYQDIKSGIKRIYSNSVLDSMRGGN